MKIRLVLMAMLGLMCLSGCWDSSGNDTTLTLAISDTPVDGAESVVVTFTGVQVQPASGAMIEVNYQVPRQIDLLQLQRGDFTLLLNDLGVAAGNFTSIRMLVDMSKSNITLADGSVHPLMLAGSEQTSILLDQQFTVGSGQQGAFLIDFDLRKSISQVSGGSTDYLLQPALRFVAGQKSGDIHGTISNTFMIGTTAISDPSCLPAAYIYSGDSVTPVDINPTSKVQPVQTATVFLGQSSGNYYYHAAYLAPGNYTVALVCAGADDPSTTDTLTFAEPQDAPVTANFITEVDFP